MKNDYVVKRKGRRTQRKVDIGRFLTPFIAPQLTECLKQVSSTELTVLK